MGKAIPLIVKLVTIPPTFVLGVVAVCAGSYYINTPLEKMGDETPVQPQTVSIPNQSAEEVLSTQTQSADPTITCTSDKCGDKLMLRSQCSTVTCCELGDGSWEWHAPSDCQRIQAEYWHNYYADKNDEKDEDLEDMPEFPSLEPLPSLELTVPDYSTSTPVPSNDAARKECEDSVREDTRSQIDGCYVRFEGSAADACASGYQNSEPELIDLCRSL